VYIFTHIIGNLDPPLPILQFAMTPSCYSPFPKSLLACRSQVVLLEKENKEMREDLQAVDPEFFAQIEDLKYAYHVLKQEHAELQEQTRSLPESDLLHTSG